MYLLLIIIISLLNIKNLVNCETIDWCEMQQKHCNKKIHIGCDPSHIGQGNCYEINELKMDENMRREILNQHNEYRSFLASGLLFPMKSAKQMQEMEWDETLEQLASMHVQNCKMKHDQCRSTDEYNYAGQNLGMIASTYKELDFNGVIKNIINNWFKEYVYTPVYEIEKFVSEQTKQIGHFTVMSREKNNKIGCAFITYEEYKDNELWYGNMLTCNYAETNLLETPVYQRGTPCSGCAEIGMSCSLKYSNLCSRNLVIRNGSEMVYGRSVLLFVVLLLSFVINK